MLLQEVQPATDPHMCTGAPVLTVLLSSSSSQWCRRRRWRCAGWPGSAVWAPCSRCPPPAHSARRGHEASHPPARGLWRFHLNCEVGAPFLQPQKKWRPDSNHLKCSQFTSSKTSVWTWNNKQLSLIPKEQNVKPLHREKTKGKGWKDGTSKHNGT